MLAVGVSGIAGYYVITAPPRLAPDARVIPNPNGYDAVKAIVVRLTPTSKDSPILKKNSTASALRVALERDRGDIAKLHDALRLPYMTPAKELVGVGFSYSSGIDVQIREGARKLVGESRLARAEGRNESAMEAALDAVAIGIKAPRGGAIIDALVGCACVNLGATDALMLIEKLDLAETRRQRRRLEQLLTEVVGEREALQEERRQSLLDPHLGRAKDPISRLMTHQVDQVYKEAIAETDKPLAFRQQPASAGSTFGSMIATTLPDFRKSLVKRDRLLATLRLRLAVEEFRKSHHRLPESLDDLIPTILAAPPLDPPTQKPLKYRRLGEMYEIAPP